MELRRWWYVLTRWAWLIGLATILAAGVSFLVSRSTVPTYSASTTILVDQAQNPATPDYNSVLASERLTQTYGQIIKTRPVLQQAIADLHLSMTVEQLDSAASVRVIPNTQLLELSVEDPNPSTARDLANTIAKDFIELNRADRLGTSASSQQVLQAQISGLDKQINESTARLDQLRATGAGQSADAVQLQNSLSQLQVTYSQLLQTQEGMQLNEARAVDSVRVVEPAVLPEAPVRPKVVLNVALAAAVGLLLGLGAAFLIEYLDDTVKTPDDVEETVGLNSLGTIRRMPKRDPDVRQLITELRSHSPVAEAYRILRMNVDFARVGHPGQILLVTSSNQREGKTTTLANLAIVMAESGRRVIAIDSDLRRPMLHKAFGLANDAGLTNLLLADEPDGDAITAFRQHTKVDNLDVIACGPIPPNPSELLASERLARLLATLRGEADLILMDSSPVLAVADPTVLSARVDGVILVVDSCSTRREALLRARDMLTRGTGQILGVVINKVTSQSGSSYYNYYYDGGGNNHANGNNASNGHQSDDRPLQKSGGRWARLTRTTTDRRPS